VEYSTCVADVISLGNAFKNGQNSVTAPDGYAVGKIKANDGTECVRGTAILQDDSANKNFNVYHHSVVNHLSVVGKDCKLKFNLKTPDSGPVLKDEKQYFGWFRDLS